MATRLPIATGQPPQPRAADGRFSHRMKRYGRSIRRKDRGGPGWLGRKTTLELARFLLSQLNACDRFRVELGDEVEDAIGAPPARIERCLEMNSAIVRRRLAAVDEVLHKLNEERRANISAKELAALVSEQLGEPFSERALYRRPYDTAWRYPRDHVGREDLDSDPRMNALLRLSKRQLIRRIGAATMERNILKGRSDEAAVMKYPDMKPLD